MIYKVDCPTPANTPKLTPSLFRVRVTLGVTEQVWVGFPPGCKGLCHLQVWHWGWPVWPWSPGDSFHWDGYMFTFHDSYELKTEPLELVIKTWNLDDTYAHTPTFAVHIESVARVPWSYGQVAYEGALEDLGGGY